MEALQTHWTRLCGRNGINAKQEATLWNELEQAYSDPSRHYHNLDHLRYMLHAAQDVIDQFLEADAVLFAIFYHDVVYNARRSNNEEKSAELAVQRLNTLQVPEPIIDACAKMILATKSHTSTGDTDTDLMVDLDLAILGDSPDVYQRYTRNIRAEYAMFPGFLYRRGRKKVLQHFLAMERIFKSEHFHDALEELARYNLREELKAL